MNVEKYLESLEGRLQAFGDKYRVEVVLPFCNRSGFSFVSEMGVWYFRDPKRNLNLNTVSEDLKVYSDDRHFDHSSIQWRQYVRICSDMERPCIASDYQSRQFYSYVSSYDEEGGC